eukprot:gene1554-9738_t
MLRAAALLAAAAAAGAAKLRDPIRHDCRSKVTNQTLGLTVADEYIVVLKRDAAPEKHSLLAASYGAKKSWAIGTGPKSFRAFHAKLAADRLGAVLAEDDVEFVEPNQVMHAMELPQAPPRRPQCPETQTTQVSWGQERTTALSASAIGSGYRHDSNWGRGVDVYVCDTGIRTTHEDFGGRAEWGTNLSTNNGVEVSMAKTCATAFPSAAWLRKQARQARREAESDPDGSDDSGSDEEEGEEESGDDEDESEESKTPGELHYPGLHYGGQPVAYAAKVRFLGLLLDEAFTFDRHIEGVAEKMGRGMRMLKSVAGTSWGCRRTTLRTLYLTLMQSIADFALPAYAPHVRDKALKPIRGVEKE